MTFLTIIIYYYFFYIIVLSVKYDITYSGFTLLNSISENIPGIIGQNVHTVLVPHDICTQGFSVNINYASSPSGWKSFDNQAIFFSSLKRKKRNMRKNIYRHGSGMRNMDNMICHLFRKMNIHSQWNLSFHWIQSLQPMIMVTAQQLYVNQIVALLRSYFYQIAPLTTIKKVGSLKKACSR